MQSPDEFIESYTHDTKIKLLRRGSEYLYQTPFPTQPNIFYSKETVVDCCSKHN